MRLIGMLDSPYVRRVAISLDVLGIAFTHEAVSVFNHFAHFRSLNPVVKAPTLILDDGTVLMDSSLILQYAESALGKGLSLWRGRPNEMQLQYRAVGLALAACEKTAQTIYETNLRPAEKQHAPWLNRVRDQLQVAFSGLEQEVAMHPQLFSGELTQASITAAVTWQFCNSMVAELIPSEKHPALVTLSQRLEQHPAFVKYPPLGPGVQAQ